LILFSLILRPLSHCNSYPSPSCSLLCPMSEQQPREKAPKRNLAGDDNEAPQEKRNKELRSADNFLPTDAPTAPVVAD
ncbi:hypothetical protein PFISCL1PPCAC_26494, partial [Pristionchus fissidentatus]